MRAITVVITLALFIIYSLSLPVVWCLYFLEKQDIILYYCVESEVKQPNSSAFMQQICDGITGKHRGARSLLQLSVRASVYDIAVSKPEIQLSRSTIIFLDIQQQSLLPAHILPVFHPPCA